MNIFVDDTRPEGHNSLSVLPRIARDDFESLQLFYHMEIDTTYGEKLAKNGELYWALVGFELKAGPAVIQPQVWKQDGTLYTATPGDDANVALALHWPGADVLDPAWKPQYKGKAIIGWTEGDGSVGWGYGADSHIGPEGGPYSVWVMAGGGKVGSNCVHRLGWWDDHITPNPIFQIAQKGGDVPPPTGAEYLVNIDAAGNTTGHVQWVPGAPGTGHAALGLMREGVVVAHIIWQS